MIEFAKSVNSDEDHVVIHNKQPHLDDKINTVSTLFFEFSSSYSLDKPHFEILQT